MLLRQRHSKHKPCIFAVAQLYILTVFRWIRRQDLFQGMLGLSWHASSAVYEEAFSAEMLSRYWTKCRYGVYFAVHKDFSEIVGSFRRRCGITGGAASVPLSLLHAVAPDTDAAGVHCPNKVDMLRKLLTVAPEALVNCKIWTRASDVVAEGQQKPSDMQALCATCGQQYSQHAGLACQPSAVQPLRVWGDAMRPRCEGHVWLNGKGGLTQQDAVGGGGTTWAAGRILQHLGESLYAVEYTEGSYASEDTQIINLTQWTLGVQAEAYVGQELFTPLHVLCHDDISQAVQNALGVSLSLAMPMHWPTDKFHATSLVQIFRQIQHLHAMAPVDSSNLRDAAATRILPLSGGADGSRLLSLDGMAPLVDIQLTGADLSPAMERQIAQHSSAMQLAAAAVAADRHSPASAQSAAMAQYIASVASMLRQALAVHTAQDAAAAGAGGWMGQAAAAELQRRLAVPLLQSLATYLNDDAVRQLLVMQAASGEGAAESLSGICDTLLQDVLAALAAFNQAQQAATAPSEVSARPLPSPHMPSTPSLLRLRRSLSGTGAADGLSVGSPAPWSRRRRASNAGNDSLYAAAHASAAGASRSHYLDTDEPGADSSATPTTMGRAAGEDVLAAVVSLGLKLPSGTSPMLQRALQGVAQAEEDAAVSAPLVARLCAQSVVAGLRKLQHSLQPRCASADGAAAPLMDSVQVLPNFEYSARMLLLSPSVPGSDSDVAEDAPMTATMQAALTVYSAREALQAACWALAASVDSGSDAARSAVEAAQAEYRSAQALLLKAARDSCSGNLHKALHALAANTKGLRDVAAAQQLAGVEGGEGGDVGDRLVFTTKRSTEDELLRIAKLPELTEENWDKIVRLPGLPRCLAGPVASTAQDIVSSAVGVAEAPPTDSFALGDQVRVRLSVLKPRHNWGSVKPGEIGTVAELQGGDKMKVDFPNSKSWSAHIPEMELAGQAEQELPEGAVQQLLLLPSEDRLCIIEAIKCWAERQLQNLIYVVPGLDKKLGGAGAEAARALLAADREVATGVFVRVKDSVSEPGLGWGPMSRPVTAKVATYSSEAMVAMCDVPGSDDQWTVFAADLAVVPGPSELWSIAKAFGEYHGVSSDGAASVGQARLAERKALNPAVLRAMQEIWLDAGETAEAAKPPPPPSAAGEEPAPPSVSGAAAADGYCDGYANFSVEEASSAPAAVDPLTPERIAEIRRGVSIGTVHADTGKELILPPHVLDMLPSPTREALVMIVHIPYVPLMLHGADAPAARSAVAHALQPLDSGEKVSYTTEAEELLQGAVIEATPQCVTVLGADSSVLNLHPTQVLRQMPDDEVFSILKAYSNWRSHSRKASRLLHSLSTAMPAGGKGDDIGVSSEPRSLWEVLGLTATSNAGSAHHASMAQATVAVVDLALVSLLDLAQHGSWLAEQLTQLADGAGSATCQLQQWAQSEQGSVADTLQSLIGDAAAALLPRTSSFDAAGDESVALACRLALPSVHGAMAVRCMQIIRARGNTMGALLSAGSAAACLQDAAKHTAAVVGVPQSAVTPLLARSAGLHDAQMQEPSPAVGPAVAAGSAAGSILGVELTPKQVLAFSQVHAAALQRAMLAGSQVGGSGLRRVLVGPAQVDKIKWGKINEAHGHVRAGKGVSSVAILRQKADGTASSADAKCIAVRASCGWTSGVHEWTTVVVNSDFGTSTEVGICTEQCAQVGDVVGPLLGSAACGGDAWVLSGGDRQGLFYKDQQSTAGVPGILGFPSATHGSSKDVLETGLDGGAMYLWKLDCDDKIIELRVCADRDANSSSLVSRWSIAGVWDGESRLFPCAASTRENAQVEILPLESQRVMRWSEYQLALEAAQEAAVASERKLLQEIGSGVAAVTVDSGYAAATGEGGLAESDAEASAAGAAEAIDMLQRVQASSIHRVRDIGMGGFGVVSLVECDEFPGMQFACKQLQSGISFEQTTELQAINAIQRKSRHPNIVWVQALVQTGDVCTGLLMGYAAGGCLTKTIFPEGAHVAAPMSKAGQPGPFERLPSLRKRMQWSVQIASALAHLHELHVWHRDFKPDNVLLTSSNWHEADAKLADFGQSKMTHSGATQNTRTTTTMLYFPPEAMEDKWNAASDVYQLGLTLFQVLTGHVLWSKLNTSTNQQAVLMKLLCVDKTEDIADSVGEWPTTLPVAARDLVRACLKRNYADRPTARQVAVGLNAAMTSLSRSFRISGGLSSGSKPGPEFKVFDHLQAMIEALDG